MGWPAKQSTTASTALVWYGWTLNFSFMGSPSDRLDVGAGRHLGVDLHGIDLHRNRRETAVAEDHAQRFMRGEFLDEIFGDAGVEAGDKFPVCRLAFADEENGLALNRLAANRMGQPGSPVHQNLEEQIFGCAVGFDVVDGLEKVALVDLVRAVVNVLHVRRVDLQDAEADVFVPVRMSFSFEGALRRLAE